MVTILQLRSCGLEELEELYAREGDVSLPEGCFRGAHLARLETPGARLLRWRLAQAPIFELVPFGVDFQARRWFFFRRSIALGRFEPTVGPSRWRETETIRLDYSGSSLPAPVRELLYDEVKPLSENLYLGIGGIDAPRGEGDHFFFALERM